MKSILSALLFFSFSTLAPAAAVINWVTTNGDSTFGGTETTNSPVATDAISDTIVGSFPAITLTTSQSIILTGRVNLSGSGSIPGNQFRWGLFDAPGTPATGVGSNYIGVYGSAPAGTAGSISTANGSTTNPFSGTAATSVVTASDVGGQSAQYGTNLDFSLTIKRLNATQIEVSGLFTNGSDVLINWAETTTTASPSNFTYDSVGILLGGTLTSASATFTDIQVNTIPEPASALLGGLGFLVLIRRRRP